MKNPIDEQISILKEIIFGDLEKVRVKRMYGVSIETISVFYAPQIILPAKPVEELEKEVRKIKKENTQLKGYRILLDEDLDGWIEKKEIDTVFGYINFHTKEIILTDMDGYIREVLDDLREDSI